MPGSKVYKMFPSQKKIFPVSLLLIAALLSPVRLEQCYEHDFGWKGNNVKALNDCDILKVSSTLHLDR